MTYTSTNLTLRDGNILEYVQRPGGQSVVILIHGYADSWYSFKGVIDFLPDSFCALAPSLLGHGRSSKPLRPYSIEGYAEDILDFMRSIGVERATLVGHSMGSFVAQCVALKAPQMVSQLVLIGTAVTADNLPLRGLYNEVLRLPDPIPAEFISAFQGGTCVGPLDPSMSMDEILSESSLLPAHVWLEALKGLIGYRTADFDESALHALKTPTLVLGGTQDEIFSEAAQRRLAAALPNAMISLDPTCGHSPNWEHPQRTASQIADFVLAPPDPNCAPLYGK